MGGAFVYKGKDSPDFQIVAIASQPQHCNFFKFCIHVSSPDNAVCITVRGFVVGANLFGHRDWILEETGVDVLTGEQTRAASAANLDKILHNLLTILFVSVHILHRNLTE